MLKFYGINENKELLDEIDIQNGINNIHVSFDNVENYSQIMMEWTQDGMSTISEIRYLPEFNKIEVGETPFHDDAYIWIFGKKDNQFIWNLNELREKLEIFFVLRLVPAEDEKMILLLSEMQELTGPIRNKYIGKYEEKKKEYDKMANSTFWKLTLGPQKLVDRIRNRHFVLPAKINPKANGGFERSVVRVSNARRQEEQNYPFTKNITFSILVPLYNTPIKYLKEMIESVQNQTYRKWELCLADASDAKHADVEKTVQEYIQSDARIRYARLKDNNGISSNTNECAKMATGEFISLLDHDDVLHPSALFMTMKEIEEHNADFVYTDEVTFIDDNLEHFHTLHYKPDYAQETLLSNNYICHFSSFKKEIFDAFGGFRDKYNGSQDHDLIMHLTDMAENVCHVPQILYFWRSHANSTAQSIDSKPYAILNGQQAVHDFVQEKGMHNYVTSSKAAKTIYHIHYEIVGNPKVSIIIPNKDHYYLLKNCISSILSRTNYDNYEIIIVDNGSTDANIDVYYRQLSQFNNIRVIHYDKPFNYSAMNNEAVRQCSGEYVLFLNNDTEVISPEWMSEMLMYAQQKDIGAVGAKLYYLNDTIQHAGVICGVGKYGIAEHAMVGLGRRWHSLGYMGRDCYSYNMMAVTAACMMVKKTDFERVGGFDEKDFAVAYNDIDLCLKLYEAGKRNVFNAYAELYHFESISRGLDHLSTDNKRFEKEIQAFHQKWDHLLEKGDPYYNPNLSKDGRFHVPKEVI